MALIALKKWAIQNNIQPASARQKALRGKFVTAQKIGSLMKWNQMLIIELKTKST